MTMKYEWSDFQVGPEKGTVAAGFDEFSAELAELKRQVELTGNSSANDSGLSCSGGSPAPVTPALTLAFAFLGVLAHEYIHAVKQEEYMSQYQRQFTRISFSPTP